MTALTADRNTPRAQGDFKSLAVAAAALLYAGSIAMRNATGYAVKPSAVTTLVGVGCAMERVDNSAGGNGDLKISVRPGIFRFANSASGDLITIADIGKPAYAVDDQTVAKTSNTNTRSIAGFVYDVDDIGVWVEFDEARVRTHLAGIA